MGNALRPLVFFDSEGTEFRLKVQADKPISSRRHGLVIGKTRSELENKLPSIPISSNGHHGKVIATLSDGTLVPVMIVSTVADSGAVSFHICENAALKLSIDEKVLKEAGDDGINEASLQPLRG